RIGPATNAFRAELGLPPVQRLMHVWWHSPQRVIGLFPGWFCPPQPDWPPETVLTSFPLWDSAANTEMPAEAEAFLQAGDPPVVATPGTTNRFSRTFFAAVADGCQRLGLRAMLMTRHHEQLPDRLPDGIRAFSYVPFSRLLP